MNSFYKNLALWLLIGLIMVTLFNLFQSGSGKVVDLDYSDFLAKIEEGKVTDVGSARTTSRAPSRRATPPSAPTSPTTPT